MKTAQLALHPFRARFVLAAASMLLCGVSARAATIQIGFTGMNLVYDGSTITDAGSSAGGVGNPAQADSLASVDFFVDSTLVGSLSSDISVDIDIPDVLNIPSAANAVYNQTTVGNPGYFDLLIGTSPLASEYLQLDLEEVTVSYFDVSGLVQFTFGAAVAASNSQNLPFSLEIGDPVTLSFSAQVSPGTKTSAGGFITGFGATGTGEIRGELVPEPSTFVLAGMGALAMSLVARRRRRS